MKEMIARVGDTVTQSGIESVCLTGEEIVRCKNCKHLFDGERKENCCDVLMEKADWLVEISVDPDWFCANGERKGE